MYIKRESVEENSSYCLYFALFFLIVLFYLIGQTTSIRPDIRP